MGRRKPIGFAIILATCVILNYCAIFVSLPHPSAPAITEVTISDQYGNEWTEEEGVKEVRSFSPSKLCNFGTLTNRSEASSSSAPILKNILDYANPPFSKDRPIFQYYNSTKVSHPIVTVITTYYNSQLMTASDCILGQSLVQIEWIIVNDGSSDLQLLNPLRTVPRVRVIDSSVHRGIAAARNIGIRAASPSSRYFFFLDAGDYIEPTYLEKAVWFLETHPQYALVNAWSVNFGQKEFLWTKGFHDGEKNLEDNQITIALMMRANVLRAVGMFDETLRFGMEDWDLWIRCLDHGHWGYTLEEFLFWYRVSPPGQWAAISSPQQLNDFKRSMREKYPKAYGNEFPRLSPVAPKYSMVSSGLPFHNALAKRAPRLLLIVPFTRIGGADMFTLRVVRRLVQSGWEVTVATMREDIRSNSLMPQFLQLTPDVFILPNIVPINEHPRFLSYLIHSRQPDITLLSNTEDGYMYLEYLRTFAPNTIFMDYCHSEDPEWKLGGYPRYSIQSEPVLDRSLFASDYVRNWAISHGHNPEKCAVVPNGIDTALFTRNVTRRQAIRERESLSEDTAVIFYVARLESGKLPFVFAKVMEKLAKAGYKFHAYVIGSGSMEKPLESMLSSMGTAVTSRVTMLGAKPNSEVIDWLNAGDIMFLPTEREGISLSLMEGMAMGLVPVSVNVGGQRELVTPDLGFLVDLSSEDSMVANFASALSQLIQNQQLLRSYSRNSIASVKQSWTELVMMERMEQEFCNARTSNAEKESTTEKSDVKVVLENTRRHCEFLRMQEELESLWVKSQSAMTHSANTTVIQRKEIWDDGMTLLASGIPSSVKAGEGFQLTLLWTTSKGPTLQQYQEFIHFKRGDHIFFQGDRIPTMHGKQMKTNMWNIGEIIIDTDWVHVPSSVSAGNYTVVIGFFEIQFGSRAQIGTQNELVLDIVVVN